MARARLLRLCADALIKPQYAIQRLYELTKDRDTYITTEVGQHQMWAAQFYHFDEPNRWMTSGGLGTMGYGLPAAVGVQIAHPDSLVIDIAGDASVQMTMQEMSTPCSTTCRSRSSSSTTSGWAWSASGSSCCTASAIRIPIRPACPTS
jgi:thiamine pyrophosphate-dependent acetolactate synthase large subunit-like protein